MQATYIAQAGPAELTNTTGHRQPVPDLVTVAAESERAYRHLMQAIERSERVCLLAELVFLGMELRQWLARMERN